MGIRHAAYASAQLMGESWTIRACLGLLVRSGIMIVLDHPWSRRSLLCAARAGGVVLAGAPLGLSSRVLAAPTITVAAPHVDRIEHCEAWVSSLVTLDEVAAETRYAVFGNLLEADDREERAECCAKLDQQSTRQGGPARQTLRLTCHASAGDMRFMRDAGPTRNETDSADDVELFIRIWIRNVLTDEVLGPWNSPQHVAFTNSWLTGISRLGLHADGLWLPHSGRAPEAGPSSSALPLPPQMCLSNELKRSGE